MNLDKAVAILLKRSSLPRMFGSIGRETLNVLFYIIYIIIVLNKHNIEINGYDIKWCDLSTYQQYIFISFILKKTKLNMNTQTMQQTKDIVICNISSLVPALVVRCYLSLPLL